MQPQFEDLLHANIAKQWLVEGKGYRWRAQDPASPSSLIPGSPVSSLRFCVVCCAVLTRRCARLSRYVGVISEMLPASTSQPYVRGVVKYKDGDVEVLNVSKTNANRDEPSF